MNERLHNLLYRSLDGELTEGEQRELDRAIAASPALQQEKAQLRSMRQMMRQQRDRSFTPFFTARVMRRIREQANSGEEYFFGSLAWAFRRVALASAVAILLTLANHLFFDSSASLDHVIYPSQTTLAETWQLDLLVEEQEQ